MFSSIQNTITKDIRHLKRKYTILKIKWILLFVLPIIIIVLAYHVSKEFLKIKMRGMETKVKHNETCHDTDKKDNQPSAD